MATCSAIMKRLAPFFQPRTAHADVRLPATLPRQQKNPLSPGENKGRGQTLMIAPVYAAQPGGGPVAYLGGHANSLIFQNASAGIGTLARSRDAHRLPRFHR